MKLLYDFFPVLLFFITYKLSHDIYLATAVIMLATLIQVAGYWLKNHSVEKMQIITLVLIMILGSATLLLKDDVFIKWKPTVVNWLFALAFLFGSLFTKKPLIQHLMGQAIQLPPTIWQRLNTSWVIFFLFSGALNIYFAFYYGNHLSIEERQAIWVDFKFYGLLGLTLIFIIAQAFFLQKYAEPIEENSINS